jgi:hypothetical protein
MNDCRYRKILQFYLDGSAGSGDFKELEEHLKTCLECQIQLAELEELNSAALEIIDEAPDREYWESFPHRVRNRIMARSIEPETFVHKRRPAWYAAFRVASALVALIFVVGSSLLFLNGGISLLNDSVHGINEPTNTDSRIPAALSDTDILHEIPAPADRISGGIPSTAESDGVAQREPNSANDESQLVRKRVAPIAGPINIVISDIADRLRDARFAKLDNPRLEIEAKPYSPAFASGLGDIDPAFRLKNSFVNQRLLAGLGDRPRNDFIGAYQGLDFERSRSSMDGGRVLPANETQATWGYTSIPVDTSRSAEINQYYLELDLMKSK